MARLRMGSLGKNLHPNAQIHTHASVDRFLIGSEHWVGRMRRHPCSPKLVLGREGQPQPVPSSLLGLSRLSCSR